MEDWWKQDEPASTNWWEKDAPVDPEETSVTSGAARRAARGGVRSEPEEDAPEPTPSGRTSRPPSPAVPQNVTVAPQEQLDGTGLGFDFQAPPRPVQTDTTDDARSRRGFGKTDYMSGLTGEASPQVYAGPNETPVSEEPVNKPGTVASRTIKASGQAVENVPENLLTGWFGLKLADAEKGQEVSVTDVAMQVRGAEELRGIEAQLDKGGLLPEAEAALRERQSQLELLYGASKEIISNEIAQLKAFEKAGAEARKKIGDLDKAKIPVDAEPGSPEYYISAAIGSSAEMAPALAISVITRSPVPAMTFMTGYVGGSSYVEGRKEGLSPSDARDYALLQGLAEGIPEALPISVLIKPGTKFLTRIVSGVAAEMAQETITEGLQAGIDKGYIKPDMTWAEARSRMIDAGIIGGISGGIMGAGVSTLEAGAKGAEKLLDPRSSQGNPPAGSAPSREDLMRARLDQYRVPEDEGSPLADTAAEGRMMIDQITSGQVDLGAQGDQSSEVSPSSTQPSKAATDPLAPPPDRKQKALGAITEFQQGLNGAAVPAGSPAATKMDMLELEARRAGATDQEIDQVFSGEAPQQPLPLTQDQRSQQAPILTLSPDQQVDRPELPETPEQPVQSDRPLQLGTEQRVSPTERGAGAPQAPAAAQTTRQAPTGAERRSQSKSDWEVLPEIDVDEETGASTETGKYVLYNNKTGERRYVDSPDAPLPGQPRTGVNGAEPTPELRMQLEQREAARAPDQRQTQSIAPAVGQETAPKQSAAARKIIGTAKDPLRKRGDWQNETLVAENSDGTQVEVEAKVAVRDLMTRRGRALRLMDCINA